MQNIPLMIVPFIIYLIIHFLLGPAVFATVILTIPMLSGGAFAMMLGDLMLVLGLALLFVEVIKSTRFSSSAVINHMLSTLTTVAYLVVFLLVGGTATSVFFILMLMSLVDVLAGFSVSIRSASRDVSFNGGMMDGGHDR
ncbi:MAG: hypothetical protein H6873_02140 [Hyphomicrobiaceae bacterium]|nr:hypothetical protein [Hyphomicrobiaceae bacterium]